MGERLARAPALADAAFLLVNPGIALPMRDARRRGSERSLNASGMRSLATSGNWAT
jgi:hypothetical protein